MNKLRIRTLTDRLGGTEPLNPDYGDPGLGGGGGYGPCRINSCTTTYTGPMGVECCCFYSCPSGGLWKCTQGQYCAA